MVGAVSTAVGKSYRGVRQANGIPTFRFANEVKLLKPPAKNRGPENGGESLEGSRLEQEKEPGSNILCPVAACAHRLSEGDYPDALYKTLPCPEGPNGRNDPL